MSTFKTNTIAFWENFQQKEAEIIRLFENNQPEKNSRNGSLERSQKRDVHHQGFISFILPISDRLHLTHYRIRFRQYRYAHTLHQAD
jgi:hypothetical protein